MINRLDDGRIIRLENGTLTELVAGEWCPLTKPVLIADHWDSEELTEDEVSEIIARYQTSTASE